MFRINLDSFHLLSSLQMKGSVALLPMLLISCGTEVRREEVAKFVLPDLPRVIAEEAKFPAANRKSAHAVEKELLGLSYLGGGNLAEYDTGEAKYKLFLIRCRTAAQTGSYIFEIKKQMQEAKFVASYGGFFAANTSAGPLLVFAKGNYIGGIAGLSEEDAIQTGKAFAARIPH